ncbi:MAG: phosphodiesterase [Rhodobacteraceae bacterium]|nr:phosphodiesterase [Paracoccaceae bacterium]
MLIVQISDLHLAPEGQKTLGVAPMAENLALCIERVNALVPLVDLVMITGDITHDGTRAETENAARILQSLRAPYHVLPGNHDDRAHLWSVFGGLAIPERRDGFLNYVIKVDGLRLVAIDSVMTGGSGGHACDVRLDWLKARLDEAPDAPTAIFMHHPPTRMGVAESDLDGFEGAERMGEVIGAHANILGIFCGHIHLPAHTRWNGTIVSTAPSMGMQLAPDLTMEKPSQFVLEAPGFQLLLWSKDRGLITHTMYARNPVGPFDF